MQHFIQDNEMSYTANLATRRNSALQLRPRATPWDRVEAGHNLISERTQALYLTDITALPHSSPLQVQIHPHATMLIKALKGTPLCG